MLVDLYRIVKQSLRASTDSYSIKAIEKLYGFERIAEVSGGDESVVRFEEWVETGDDSILEEVERYNEEDCRSTFELHEWLRSIRPSTVPWRLPPDQRPPTEEAEERDAAREALKARLLDGAEEGEPRRLLANLLDYHQREARPEWWAWFRWPQLDDDELVARPHRDRRARVGRQSARARGSEPCLPDDVPAAGAQDRRAGVRSPHAGELPRPGRRRRTASSRCCAASSAATSRCRRA